MINPANREASGAQDPGRRAFLINTGVALGTAVVAEVLSPFTVLADSRRQAAVRLSEISINVLNDATGQVFSEQRGLRVGNDYVLSPTQERGKERAQRVLVRIGTDGIARERISVMKADGSFEYRNGGEVFVFQGQKDTLAPVTNICDTTPDCKIEYWDGMNIDAFRVRRGGMLEYFLTFPTAFDCNPRNQKVTTTVTTIQEQPKPPAPPTQTPPPAAPPEPPVQAPAQVPRKSEMPSLEEEFGVVAVVAASQLGRVIYE